ncbi:MAG: hypothetical protein ACRD0K_28830 [Egibacteraceae bacterium]
MNEVLGGTLRTGTTTFTHTFHHDDGTVSTVTVRNVPALIDAASDEVFFVPEVTDRLVELISRLPPFRARQWP